MPLASGGKRIAAVLLVLTLALSSAGAKLGPLSVAPLPDTCALQPVQFLGGGSLLAALIVWFQWYLQIQMRHDTSRIVKSNLDAANAINQVRLDIYDKETIRDFLPAPLSCAWLENTELANLILATVKHRVRSEEVNILDSLGQVTRAAQQEIARANRHLEEFCAPADKAVGLCDTLGKIPNGDVSAAIFMGTDQYASPAEEGAARAFIDNVANMTALAIPKHLFGTPQGRALQAKKQNLMALRALANLVLQKAYNHRRPAEQGVSGRAQFLQELNRRFGSQDWLNKISDEQASPGALQREELLIRSWQMKMEALRYEQEERIAMLLTALVSDRTDDKEEKLLQEVDAAMRAQEPFKPE